MKASQYIIRKTLGYLSISKEQRHCMIAEAAYYRAQNMSFKSDPLHDWLKAEEIIDQLLETKLMNKLQKDVVITIEDLEKKDEVEIKQTFEMLCKLNWFGRGYLREDFDIIETIKKYICPALKSASDDAFEISKIITPILAGLSFTGTIDFPLDRLYFAVFSIIIARMGISTFCDPQ